MRSRHERLRALVNNWRRHEAVKEPRGRLSAVGFMPLVRSFLRLHVPHASSFFFAECWPEVIKAFADVEVKRKFERAT